MSVLALLAAGLVAGASPKTDATCSAGAWCLEKAPEGLEPLDVWAANGQAWLVGNGPTQRWSGEWRPVPGGPAKDAFAVCGSEPGNVWVLAAGRQVHRWDGSTWTDMTANLREEIERWRPWGAGPGWISHGVPGAACGKEWCPTDPELADCWTDRSSRALVSTRNGAVLQWDGKRWALLPTGKNRVGNAFATANPVGVWLAGGRGSVWFRRDGAWEAVATGTTSELWSADDVDGALWAVGSGGTIVRGSRSRLVLEKSPTRLDLLTVWGARPDDVWAAGAEGALLHWDGRAWETRTSPTRQTLFSMAGLATGEAWCIGADGTLLHRSPPP